MANKKVNTTKLGVFMIAGVGFLVMLLYVIGKNQNLFGKTFALRAQFENVHGLMPGNNVRFAGIDAGSVKSVEVLNDTIIEVTLLVKTKMKKFIHRNAKISIATDGLIGNMVVNIEPSKILAPEVDEGDVLQGVKGLNADEMLKVLNQTNNDIAAIAAGIRNTVIRINKSKALWDVLEDESLPANIRQSLQRLKAATVSINRILADVSVVVNDVRDGKGTIGKLVRDSSIALAATEAVDKIKNIGMAADSLSSRINGFVAGITSDVNEGKGTIHTLLKDETMAQQLRNSVGDIEHDARALKEVMEALKQSFLFRGYFRKQEKQKREHTEKAGKY